MSDAVTSSLDERAIMAGICFVREAERAGINPTAILALIEAARHANSNAPSEPAPVSEAVADE